MARDLGEGQGAASLGSLLAALKRLDKLVEGAVVAAEAAYGIAASGDPFRGLRFSREDIERLLARQPGQSVLWSRSDPPGRREGGNDREAPALARLRAAFGLSVFDLDVLLVALAPEIDLRYEQLYAYLQDDVTRRRPTVDLALSLLCQTAEEKLVRRRNFALSAPLICHGLIELVADPHQVFPCLLAHYLKIDDQVLRYLLSEDALDIRLAPCCQVISPESARTIATVGATSEIEPALSALLIEARKADRSVVLYFEGPLGVGKRSVLIEAARRINAQLLSVDIHRAPNEAAEFQRMLKALYREALLRNAIVYVSGLDQLIREESPERRVQVLNAVKEATAVTILSGERPWLPTPDGPRGVLTIRFPLPVSAVRLAFWKHHLDHEEIAVDAPMLRALADRFALTPTQIADAVATASKPIAWRRRCSSVAPDKPEAPSREAAPYEDEVFAAARSQSGHELNSLAQKIDAKSTWRDIVLPEDAIAQLRELCDRANHRRTVFGDWGFGRKLLLGKGTSALFAGPSGTGKTMAAEIISNELQFDLYRIDLSRIVSKYVGETEKNLNRVFNAAKNANAILFFDEADALFGKRSEVHDAHDRYANIEIAYLLQKMETYEGLAILATNLSQNLDEAFVRRMAFTIYFPFPDALQRQRIWTTIWPEEAPLSNDLPLAVLANHFRLTGGNIKNIALAASFLAAADGQRVKLDHIIHATQREYQKLGQAMPEHNELSAHVS